MFFFSSCLSDFASLSFSTSLVSEATLTRKNSSRLFEYMPKKESLSKRGTSFFSASCKIRWLKYIQLTSRST